MNQSRRINIPRRHAASCPLHPATATSGALDLAIQEDELLRVGPTDRIAVEDDGRRVDRGPNVVEAAVADGENRLMTRAPQYSPSDVVAVDPQELIRATAANDGVGMLEHTVDQLHRRRA